MRTFRPFHRVAATLSLCALAWGALPPRASAAIHVGLTPPTQSVAPGTDFDVFVDITSAGSPFNGFDAVVTYDPSALTLLPASPTTLQQGCLLTGECSASCGNTFHVFAAAADSASVSDVLLCNQTTITGPGHLYKLRFHASSTVQVTNLDIRRASFYDAGLFVLPVATAGCQVGIGVTLGVGPAARATLRPLHVEPNPSAGRFQLVSEDDAAGVVEAELLDLQGRVLQRMGPVWLAPRARLAWDARDARGGRLPAGLYLVKLRRGGQIQTSRVIVLP